MFASAASHIFLGASQTLASRPLLALKVVSGRRCGALLRSRGPKVGHRIADQLCHGTGPAWRRSRMRPPPEAQNMGSAPLTWSRGVRDGIGTPGSRGVACAATTAPHPGVGCRALQGSSGDWGDAAGLVLRGKGIVWAWFPARRMVLLLRLGGVLGQGRGVGEACGGQRMGPGSGFVWRARRGRGGMFCVRSGVVPKMFRKPLAIGRKRDRLGLVPSVCHFLGIPVPESG